PVETSTPRLSAEAWTDLQGGPALLNRLAAGESPRAVWTALPGGATRGWAAGIAEAVTSCVASGRGAVVVVPTASHVAQVSAALEARGVPVWGPGADGGHVVLRAED